MLRKVTFNTSGSGSVNARILIPQAYLECLGIDKEHRDIEITLKGDKLIITPARVESK